jgi:hypothetical protein
MLVVVGLMGISGGSTVEIAAVGASRHWSARAISPVATASVAVLFEEVPERLPLPYRWQGRGWSAAPRVVTR